MGSRVEERRSWSSQGRAYRGSVFGTGSLFFQLMGRHSMQTAAKGDKHELGKLSWDWIGGIEQAH